MNPATVLVIDDNVALRGLLKNLLEFQGHRVLTADNGREGLEVVRQYEPDLVLLDVMMPGLDGFEVCRRLKQNPDTRLVPVVLITGLSTHEDRLKGIEAGADDFLTKPVDRLELFARVRSLLHLKTYTDELDRADGILFALARTIEGKDPYTRGHCDRLAELSARLGQRLGLPLDWVVALRRAGIVHDIGKIAVPDHILLKRGPLTPEEQQVMRDHPVVGEQICEPLKSFRNVLPIIRHHHERFDGSGYPDRLVGETIPLTARVLQIVDVFDALTTERPYKVALPLEDSLVVLENEVKRGWWDARVFAEFRAMLENPSMEEMLVMPSNLLPARPAEAALVTAS